MAHPLVPGINRQNIFRQLLVELKIVLQARLPSSVNHCAFWGLVCLLVALTVSCAHRNAAMTEVQFRGPALAEASEIGGIAALRPHREVRQSRPVVKICATGDVMQDREEGTCLVITLKNKGDIQLFAGQAEEFDELSLLVERRPENSNSNYVKIEPRAVKPRSPIVSVWSYFIEPSTTMTWKVPLKKFYDLEPGAYRALVTIKFFVGANRGSFPTSITTGPIDFVKPPPMTPKGEAPFSL